LLPDDLEHPVKGDTVGGGESPALLERHRVAARLAGRVTLQRQLAG
jgi:hypothetical protein